MDLLVYILPWVSSIDICLSLSSSNACPDPSDPKHKELQAILSHLEDEILGPYEQSGNRLSREGYENLPLPWSLTPTNSDFVNSSFERVEWDKDGVPSGPPLADGSPSPFLFSEETTPESLGKSLNAASMVVRWREAHQLQTASGEIEDCVAETVRRLDEVLSDRLGKKFAASASCTLLLMRKI